MTARGDIATGGWLVHADAARAMWDEGLSAAAIAARVGHGCSKNSVLGLAHRRGWPPRPSPIPVAGVRPVAAVPRKAPVPKAERKAPAKPPKPPKAPTASTPAPAPPPQPVAVRTCQWIESGPDERPRRWCGAPVSEPGSAWCVHHRSIVYVTRRTPWQAAA